MSITGQESGKPERFQISEETRSRGLDHINAAQEALHLALEQMTWARIQLSGLGSDPARALSVSITQCETTVLWLEKAAKQVPA